MPWWFPSRPASRRLLMVFAAAVLLAPPPAFAGGGWEVPLTVRAGREELHLSFGRKKGATAGVDGFYEVPALPRGGLRGGFLLGGHPYWRDIRAPGAFAQTWVLRISGAGPGKRVVLHWARQLFPAGQGAKLSDPAARRRVNMSACDQYVFISNGPRILRIDTDDSGANK